MEFIVIWLALSFLAGYIAEQKGRSGVGFFFLSVILSPLVGILFALVVKGYPKEAEPELRMDANGRLERVPDTKTCPFCAETIKAAARVCKHCGRDLPDTEPEAVITDQMADSFRHHKDRISS